MDQRAAQRELLLHAAGQLARWPIGKWRETGRGEQFGDARFALARGQAKEATKEVDILEDAERGIQIATQTLRHVGDARVAGAAVIDVFHIAAKGGDLAALDTAHPGNQCQQR